MYDVSQETFYSMDDYKELTPFTIPSRYNVNICLRLSGFRVTRIMEHCVLRFLIIILFEIATQSCRVCVSVCVFSNSHLQSYLHSEWIISRIAVRSNCVSNTEHHTHAFQRFDFLILPCQSRAKINGYYKLRNVTLSNLPHFFCLFFVCFSCTDISEDKNSLWHFIPFFLVAFPGIRGPLQPLRSRRRKRDVQMQQKPILLERNTITS